tara:strand:+ start:50 stop:217 length:168 start_codon:yes stop_codon:yes gene_type:complete
MQGPADELTHLDKLSIKSILMYKNSNLKDFKVLIALSLYSDLYRPLPIATTKAVT